MATTLATLRSDTYAILNDLQTSNVYASDFVDEILNEVQTELCAEWKWPFLKGKKLFLGAPKTTLAASITTSSTSITVDGVDGFETSGALWIDQDVIDYTNASTTTITGVTNIGISHTLGVDVYPLITLPTDYGGVPELLVKRTNASEFSQVEQVDEMMFDYKEGSYLRYAVTMNETTGLLYLRIDEVAADDIFSFSYRKLPATMTDAVDSSIPDAYARKILPKLAATKLQFLRNDNVEGLGQMLRVETNDEVFKMKKFYGEREQGISKLLKNAYNSSSSRYNTLPFSYRK